MANVSSTVVEWSINNPKFGVQFQLSLEENNFLFDSWIAIVEHSTYNLKFEDSNTTVTGTVERKMVKWVFWIIGSIGSTVVEQFTYNPKSGGSYPATKDKVKKKPSRIFWIFSSVSSTLVERSINNPKFGVQIQPSPEENSKTQYFD